MKSIRDHLWYSFYKRGNSDDFGKDQSYWKPRCIPDGGLQHSPSPSVTASKARSKELIQVASTPARCGGQASRGLGQVIAVALRGVDSTGWINTDEGDGVWKQNEKLRPK